MKNIAIIPARSGSKGLKDKNIKPLSGIPLIAYSIKAAKESGLFDEVMVSTDSKRYQNIAERYGANVPFLRTENTSSDTAGSWDVVREVLDRYQEIGMCFDTVCLLQPTSPLRTAENIVEGYELLIEKSANAVTSVCQTDHPPLWSMILPDDLSLDVFRKNMSNNISRQMFDQYYRLNGALYIRKIEYIGGRTEILDGLEYAYVMERRESVDIDTMEDFELAEFLLSRNHKNI